MDITAVFLFCLLFAVDFSFLFPPFSIRPVLSCLEIPEFSFPASFLDISASTSGVDGNGVCAVYPWVLYSCMLAVFLSYLLFALIWATLSLSLFVSESVLESCRCIPPILLNSLYKANIVDTTTCSSRSRQTPSHNCRRSRIPIMELNRLFHTTTMHKVSLSSLKQHSSLSDPRILSNQLNQSATSK